MRRSIRNAARLAALVLCAAAAPAGVAQPDSAPAPATDAQEIIHNTAEYNLPRSRLGLKGYDPVAYFPEGGGEPMKGRESITLGYRGVIYRFATEAHREIFRKNPKRYEPAYGGWCAWAMADGQRADIDPKSFVVKNGRLFLFFDGLFNDTRAKWLKRDHDEQASSADAAWMEQSGEPARGDHRGDADAR
jgi:hypothetical protein